MNKKVLEQEAVIYIGDNIPDLGLLKDTVYLGEIPRVLKEEMENIPALERLFVPTSQLLEKKKALEDKTSLDFLSKEEVNRYFKQRGEKA